MEVIFGNPFTDNRGGTGSSRPCLSAARSRSRWDTDSGLEGFASPLPTLKILEDWQAERVLAPRIATFLVVLRWTARRRLIVHALSRLAVG